MDVLGIVDTDRVTLELSGALNPGLLKAGNDNGNSDFLYVVMPMAV
jgi:DNA polymerase III sliding clamp (beta) subunit (PCNA family)